MKKYITLLIINLIYKKSNVFLKKQSLRQTSLLVKKICRVKLNLKFRNSTEFDWYQNWDNLKDVISQFIKKDSKILNVGAGNLLIISGNSPFS